MRNSSAAPGTCFFSRRSSPRRCSHERLRPDRGALARLVPELSRSVVGSRSRSRDPFRSGRPRRRSRLLPYRLQSILEERSARLARVEDRRRAHRDTVLVLARRGRRLRRP
jgi:hypothetical protein